MDWKAHQEGIARSLLEALGAAASYGSIYYDAGSDTDLDLCMDVDDEDQLVVLLDDEDEVCAELDQNPDSARQTQTRRYRVRVVLEPMPDPE